MDRWLKNSCKFMCDTKKFTVFCFMDINITVSVCCKSQFLLCFRFRYSWAPSVPWEKNNTKRGKHRGHIWRQIVQEALWWQRVFPWNSNWQDARWAAHITANQHWWSGYFPILKVFTVANLLHCQWITTWLKVRIQTKKCYFRIQYFITKGVIITWCLYTFAYMYM